MNNLSINSSEFVEETISESPNKMYDACGESY